MPNTILVYHLVLRSEDKAVVVRKKCEKTEPYIFTFDIDYGMN